MIKFLRLLLLTSVLSAQPQTSVPEVQDLTPQAPVFRQIPAGTKHSYGLDIVGGRVGEIGFAATGTLRLRVIDPKGALLAELQPAIGKRRAFVIPESAGRHLIEIEAEGSAGRYDLRLESIRRRTPQDELRAEAQQHELSGRFVRMADEQQQGLERIRDSHLLALSLWRRLDERIRTIDALTILGDTFSRTDDLQKALDHYAEARELLRTSPDSIKEAEILVRMAFLYDRLGDNELMLENAREALAIARSNNDQNLAGQALQRMAIALFGLDRYQHALDAGLEGLSILRKIQNRGFESLVLVRVGYIYAQLGQEKLAIDSFEKALALARAVGNRTNESNALSGIGSALAASGDHAGGLKVPEGGI